MHKSNFSGQINKQFLHSFQISVREEHVYKRLDLRLETDRHKCKEEQKIPFQMKRYRLDIRYHIFHDRLYKKKYIVEENVYKFEN